MTAPEVTLVEALAANDERGAELALECLMSSDALSGLVRLLVALRGARGDGVSTALRAEWIALARELALRKDRDFDAKIGALEARESARSPALAEVLAHPDDDAPRRAYAAVLTQRTDPRGEFIDVQCELARGVDDASRKKALEDREAALRKGHEGEWLRWLRGALGVEFSCDFHRGFAESVYVSAEAFPEVAEALFALAPVQKLTCWDVTAKAIPRLAAVAQLGRVRALDLSFNHRDARARHLGAKGARALFKSPHLGALRRLNLLEQRIGDDGALALARGQSLGALTDLNLSGNELTAAGAASLASCARLSALRTLDLVDNAIGDEGAAALASSPHLRALSELHLVSNGISARGAVALASSSAFGALETLSLGGNLLGDEGVIALAQSSALARLRSLQLWGVGVGPEGARALAESAALPSLCEVNLYGNPIGEPAAEALRARFRGIILAQ